MDIVATRYGVTMQGATCVALTKLDILSYMDEIPVCARYLLNGKETDEFPFPAAIGRATPVLETLPGWGEDISACRRFSALPKAARDYVDYIEARIGCPIRYISVGADRDAIILR